MELYAFIKDLKKGVFTQVETTTTPNWTGKTRFVLNESGEHQYDADKKPIRDINPYIDKPITKDTIFHSAIVGVSYKAKVDASLARAGVEDADYETQKPKGMHWVEENLILQSDKNEEQFYVRLTLDAKATKVETHYYLEGVEITDEEELQRIHSWEKPHNTTYKQVEAGLDEDKQVAVVSVKLENIVSVKQGENEWKLNV